MMASTNNVDIKTVEVLLVEARSKLRRASKAFKKHDNTDDMHDMENWQTVVNWLEGKLITR